MIRFLGPLLVLLGDFAPLHAGDGGVIDDMEKPRFNAGAKGKLEIVDGKVGKAVKFSFPNDCQSTFFTSAIHGKPEWDEAEGFSFWIKGDGSKHFGGLQFIYDDDYSVRYDFMFPIDKTKWTKIVVAWRDLVPVLSGPKSQPLDAVRGPKPSKLSALFIGKWWYWRDYAAHSFALDELRLEKKLNSDLAEYKPIGAPLQRTLAKLKSGKPITVVTMGDSLTDGRHWSNRQTSWPAVFRKLVKSKYQVEATIVNPALGGTELRQNLVLMPRWLGEAPEPDLVTVCFGGNDWNSGMRGPQFVETCRAAVERIRRATKGKADVLLLTTVPSVEGWRTMAELAEACRQAARDRDAGLADAEKAFLEAGASGKERLYVDDKVHVSPAGQELMARTVLEAIEAESAASR